MLVLEKEKKILHHPSSSHNTRIMKCYFTPNISYYLPVDFPINKLGILTSDELITYTVKPVAKVT